MANAAAEAAKTDEAPEITMKEVSRDNGNGIVVFKTNAKKGTEFTLKVDDEEVKAKSENGQVWFYVGRELTETSNIRLA